MKVKVEIIVTKVEISAFGFREAFNVYDAEIVANGDTIGGCVSTSAKSARQEAEKMKTKIVQGHYGQAES